MSMHKTNLLKFQNITAGSMGGSLTSAVTSILNLDNIGLEFVWSAGSTPVGTISVEISIDYAQDTQGNITNAGTWVALALSPTPSVSGNSGSIYIDINQISAPWIRAKYTRTSGSGTLNSYICGKMV